MSKTLEIADLLSEDEQKQIITNGEAAILTKLDALNELLEALTEKVDEVITKVDDLNLSENSGLSIDRY